MINYNINIIHKLYFVYFIMQEDSEDDVVVKEPSPTNNTMGGTSQYTNVFAMPSVTSVNETTALNLDGTPTKYSASK